MGKRSREKEQKREHSKAKKRKQDRSPPFPHRLVLEAAVGDRRACKKLLRAGVDVDYAAADGATALHEAARGGHLDVVELLLKYGASADVPDRCGDTPAHLAARHRHLEVLATLLQSRRPPDIEACNAVGVSVRQLAAAAMGPTPPNPREQLPPGLPGSPWGGAQCGEGLARQGRQYDSGGGEEDSWHRRLAEEMSDAEEDDIWGKHAEEYETAEEYAQRIWEEMQERRRAQRDAEMAAFRRRRREEESRREWARRQAEEASRKVLEEEKAKDAAWRQAVAQGHAGAKRASYEAKWQFFSTKHTQGEINYADVPWILPNESGNQEELQHVVLYGTTSVEEKKRRLRSELVRWHPDKFTARFGGRLAAGDKARVLDRVNAISQFLNAMSAALQK